MSAKLQMNSSYNQSLIETSKHIQVINQIGDEMEYKNKWKWKFLEVTANQKMASRLSFKQYEVGRLPVSNGKKSIQGK